MEEKTRAMEKVGMDIKALREQVLHNCTISDSHHAGLYSICGLALRLRDLYKWEKGLDPWVAWLKERILAKKG